MSITKIRGNTQIMAETITNNEIAISANIATSKLADGAEFFKRDGSVLATGSFNMNGNKITNLGAPVASSDAARLIDVQNASAGLVVKESVRLATTAEITLSGAQNIDGVAVVTGDRILVKNQTSDLSQNGIYLASTTGAWTRTTDFAAGSTAIPNSFTFVSEGNTQADTGWVLTSDAPLVVGTDDLSFVQFSGGGTYSGSNVNTSGVGVFKQMNGNVFEFRGIDQAASGKVTATLNATNNTIELDIGALTLTNADISTTAAIERSKLASGNANRVIINDASGVLSEAAAITASRALISDANGIPTHSTVTSTELGYVSGVTSSIQTQLNGKEPSFVTLPISKGGTNSGTALNNDRVMISSGGAIVEHAAITANRALASNGSGLPVATAVTDVELGYVSGVTSSIQTQLNSKVSANKYIAKETPSGAIDGSNVTFTLASTPVAGSEMIFFNGVLQDVGAGNDYTISGATITMLFTPQTGDKIRVTYIAQ